MKSSVTAKLFVAILASSVLVALAMGIAARVSFTRGFLGYLNEQGRERMEDVLPELAAAYRSHGSWEFLRDDRRAWFRLIRPQPVGVENDRNGDRNGGDRAGDRNGDGDRGRDRDRDGDAGRDRDHDRTRDDRAAPRPPDRAGEQRPAPAPSGVGPPPPPAPPPPDVELTGINLRFAVLDARSEWVIGHPSVGPTAIKMPVEVDGRTVGFLAMVPFEQATVEADVRFQHRQLIATWIIGALALLIAGGVAFGLARVFLAPVKRVAAATRRLAAGDYATRVKVASRDEFGSLAEDFNQLAFSLERNEKMRRAFIADVSHELRTPLSVLKGEIEALEDGVRPLSRESLRSLQGEVTHLSKLVSDLYDLSLSDAGALTYRKTELDAAELLHACLESVRERFAARGLRLVEAPSSAEMRVFADENRLRQLFSNLLENSARYTDAGGELRVAIRQEAQRVRIDFEDSAPGVPDDLLPRLFERFYRVEASRNRAHGGAGLGLSICRNIAEAHGGRLSASASRLGGLHMTLTLPLALPGASA